MFDERTGKFHTVESRMPEPFELVEVTDGNRIVKGWWTGSFWDGFRIPTGFKPIKWRKIVQRMVIKSY